MILPKRLLLAFHRRPRPNGNGGGQYIGIAVDPGYNYLENLFNEGFTIADIDVLKDKGVSEQTIEDTVNVVSLLNYVNRLVDAFGVEGSPDYFNMVGTSLAKNGYAALIPKDVA